MIPRFSFPPPPPPPIFFLPLRYFFGRKKLLFLGGKNVKICDFGQKKPSDFGEDLFFSFFFFGDHLLLVGKFVISARKIRQKPLPPDFNFTSNDLAKLATPLHIPDEIGCNEQLVNAFKEKISLKKQLFDTNTRYI